MNRPFQIFVLIAFGVGEITLALSGIFRDNLSDFQLGFCEGLSATGIILGGIYMVWSFAHKRNPFVVK